MNNKYDISEFEKTTPYHTTLVAKRTTMIAVVIVSNNTARMQRIAKSKKMRAPHSKYQHSSASIAASAVSDDCITLAIKYNALGNK